MSGAERAGKENSGTIEQHSSLPGSCSNPENVLVGLDVSAASLNVKTLEANRKKSGRIVVHTDKLKHIHPFCIAVFQGHLPRLKRGLARVTFSEENRIT